MSRADFAARIAADLDAIARQGLTKPERRLASPQGPVVRLADAAGAEREVINLCANDYLGLAGDPRVAEAAARAARDAGAGMASVRFICGTHVLHKALERAIADYLGFDDAILFAAAFDANGAVFEPLLDEADAVVSASLNHASIIDGIRLCKARRHRYAAGDLADLDAQLAAARAGGARAVLLVTDGVFSMDGEIADLAAVTALADRYGALVMVDDCHATGVLGPGGRGVAALHGVEGRIDILTGTFGKALGGAMGGFVAASGPVVALLRQRARPYLFSNALAPAVCAAALAAIGIARGDEGEVLRAQLAANAARLRDGLAAAGFTLAGAGHPITPVMLGEARLAQAMADDLLGRGVLVTGFSYPVVPRGQARIRAQVGARHTGAQIDAAVAAFVQARQARGDLA
ncbi:glycine C-acetyltransferase [Caulobacter sp. KR2-114]|uniref:glycine C-acetyltransferase n=1 Tax=Caulobacter sp. KR2-114 TaxID=3400912 RepID=UPI003C057E3C